MLKILEKSGNSIRKNCRYSALAFVQITTTRSLIFVTNRVRSTKEGYVFTGVCLLMGGGGVPQGTYPLGQVLTGEGGTPRYLPPWPRYLPPRPGPDGDRGVTQGTNPPPAPAKVLPPWLGPDGGVGTPRYLPPSLAKVPTPGPGPNGGWEGTLRYLLPQPRYLPPLGQVPTGEEVPQGTYSPPPPPIGQYMEYLIRRERKRTFLLNEYWFIKYFQQLVAHRKKFVTEKVIVQYFGLIKNNMVDIEGKRFENTPRERKLFYQVNVIKVKNVFSFSQTYL